MRQRGGREVSDWDGPSLPGNSPHLNAEVEHEEDHAADEVEVGDVPAGDLL